MTKDQESAIAAVVDGSLTHAEFVWGEVGGQIRASLTKNRSIQAEAMINESCQETQIPGYAVIDDGKPAVDDFIAIVVDIAGSTMRLRTEINAKVTRLQRVYYETSAILPAMAKVISYGSGNVTEYLGDGILALFRTSKDTLVQDTRTARDAAKDCLHAMEEVVNPMLAKRYSLPPASIKIGMSISQAIVTTVGILGQYTQPKAIGECVYFATKLAAEAPTITGRGVNKIYIDEEMFDIFPKAKDGQTGFKWAKFSIGKRTAYWID